MVPEAVRVVRGKNRMAIDGTACRGALYRCTPHEWAVMALDGLGISNGVGWNAAADQMFYVDSLSDRVDMFEYKVDTGDVRARSVCALIEPDAGVPDGLTVDDHVHVWVALFDGGAIRRYDPAGRLVQTIEVPVSRPTACAFGGPELDRLFVTTARLGLSQARLEAGPLAGSVLVCEPGVAERCEPAVGFSESAP